MVIYNSEDSDNMMQSLSANIKTAKAIFDKMTQGIEHLKETIDSGALSGAAYNAGKNLFLAYIFPMVKKLNAAIMDIENDLKSYKSADREIRSVGNHLNEDELRAMLSNTNKLIQLLEKKIEEDKKYIQKLISLHFEDLVQGLAELPRLEQQLDNLKDLKRDYEKKLEALQNFASTTAPLFKDSIQAFEYALQGVDAINQSIASSDGTIIVPAGVSMEWAKQLKNETFNSKLSKKQDKIEIRTIEVADDTIYQIYKNGKLDQKLTNAFYENYVIPETLNNLKNLGSQSLENLKKYGPQLLKDLSGITDVEIIFDKKSSFLKKSWSIMMLIPPSKALKLVKMGKLIRAEKSVKYVDKAGILKKVKNPTISSKAANHLKNVERVTRRGISGGHNSEAFYGKLDELGGRVISEKPHPTVPGIKNVKYELPRKGNDGTPLNPPEYKRISSPKTIYDPKVISDEQMYQWGQEAMKDGLKNGIRDGREIKGTASNGLEFIGYFEGPIENKVVKNFFPIIE